MAIRSDDPNALNLLQNKLAEYEALQIKMKEANKALKKNDVAKLMELGYDEAGIAELRKPDFSGRTGFPNYELTNNSAEIRRLKKRIEELSLLVNQKTVEYELFWDCRCVENVEDNRVQLFFHEKPCKEVREILKSNGFKWSPTNEVWQRLLNSQGKSAAQWVKTLILKAGVIDDAFPWVVENYRAGKEVWREISEEYYDAHLGCLPPEVMGDGGFLYGDIHIRGRNNTEVRLACRYYKGKYYAQIMTRAEYDVKIHEPIGE